MNNIRYFEVINDCKLLAAYVTLVLVDVYDPSLFAAIFCVKIIKVASISHGVVSGCRRLPSKIKSCGTGTKNAEARDFP